MNYEVEGVRPRGTQKKTWKEVTENTVRSKNFKRRMLWTAKIEKLIKDTIYYK